MRRALATLIIGLCLTPLGREPAMAFGKPLVLCSPLEGRLVDAEGAPVPGARLERRWEWGWTGDAGSDGAVTDADGRFAFPMVTGRSLTARIAPHEPSIRIEVSARGADGPVTLLALNKSSYDQGSEAEKVGQSGPALRLRCRIDAEPSDAGLYWGTCTAED